MASFINVARWEGFKLRQRRMPWILLAVFLGFTQLAVWGNYLAYNAAVASGGFVSIPEGMSRGMPRGLRCDDLKSKPSQILPAQVSPQAVPMLLAQCEQQLATRYRSMLPMGSTSAALGVANFIGLVLLAILGASAFGSEYSLGTLRPILVRGVGRSSWLAGKFLLLAAAVTAALLLVLGAAALGGVLISKMVVPPTIPLDIAGSWSDVAQSCLRVWASMLAFLTMASAITLFTRSTAAGMAVSLGWYIFESVFIRLMSAAFSWFATVADYLPMRNLAALGRASFGPVSALAAGSTISTTHASLMTAVYAVGFAGLAVAVFRSRDIGGISGG
ncbi:MAG: ABC transporter permease subunit [Pseudomonadota bacterium]